jgi:hypothetical protein
MIPDGVQTVRLGDVVSPHFCVFVARVVHVVASLNRPGPIFIENDDRPSPVYLCSLNGDTAHSHTLHHRSGFIAPRSTFLAQRSADPGLSISISPQENKQSTDRLASTSSLRIRLASLCYHIWRTYLFVCYLLRILPLAFELDTTTTINDYDSNLNLISRWLHTVFTQTTGHCLVHTERLTVSSLHRSSSRISPSSTLN